MARCDWHIGWACSMSPGLGKSQGLVVVVHWCIKILDLTFQSLGTKVSFQLTQK